MSLQDQSNSPSFKSSIPEHLLEKCTAQERWIMEHIDILKQSSEYTIRVQQGQGQELERQTKELADIKIQTTATNGKVIKHTEQLAVFESIKNDIVEIIETKNIIKKLFGSKWFYIAVSLLVIGLIAVFKDHSLSEWLKTFLV